MVVQPSASPQLKRHPEIAVEKGFDPFGIPLLGNGDQNVQGIDSCSQQPYTITGFYDTWWTDDTSIATANMWTMSGVANGSTYNNAQGLINEGDGQSQNHTCPNTQDRPAGGVQVHACPTTVTVAESLNIPLENIFPNKKTGSAW